MDGLSAERLPYADLAPHDIEQLIHEHHALLRHYARAQLRCADLLARQAEELAVLRSQAIRHRAEIVLRDTALAWAREDRSLLEASIPGLSRRAALSRRVEGLVSRVQDLMRERLHWQRRPVTAPLPGPGEATVHSPADGAELAALEASLVAADLVICQTGCLSHGAYWRVQDHCKRTGKACVLVAQPGALHIVRIQADPVS
jgi:hypothetical protein